MEQVKVERSFEEELKFLLNTYSKENSCNTPDFILAQYLDLCLRAFTTAVNRRDRFDENNERGPGDTNPLSVIPDHPRGGDGDQLVQCMPAELREN